MIDEDRLVLRTPEGISFSLPLAGPVSRLLACAIDVACVSVLSSFAGAGLGLLGLVSADLARALMVLAYFVISVGYGMITEWFWRGQTLGKRILQLRVIDADGLRLTAGQVVVRNLLRFVDLLPAFYLVGGAFAATTRRAQRLGDIAANTIVIRNVRVAQPDLDQLLAGKFNSLREAPHLAARLRHSVSPAAAAVALQALVRRDELEPEARVRLFADIAAGFRSLVEFPPETADAIGDEQYVRDVVDIVYRSGPRAEASPRPSIRP